MQNQFESAGTIKEKDILILALFFLIDLDITGGNALVFLNVTEKKKKPKKTL